LVAHRYWRSLRRSAPADPRDTDQDGPRGCRISLTLARTGHPVQSSEPALLALPFSNMTGPRTHDETRAPSGGAGQFALPIHYRDGTVASLVYPISRERAEAALEGTSLRPVQIPKVGCVASITWFEYGATSIGPYNELAVSVAARLGSEHRTGSLLDWARGGFEVGGWVVSLPVDSEVARVGGVELLGLPKCTLELTSKSSASSLSVEVRDGGRSISALQVHKKRGIRLSVHRIVIYSKRSGSLLRTTIKTSWRPELTLPGQSAWRPKAPDHPLVEATSALGIEGKPLAIVHGSGFEAWLPEPEILDLPAHR